jgi:membrane protein implicated in regulation of membrane protease activity
MLVWLFMILAIVGGTIMVCQFVLTLVGMGGDVDIADDLPDAPPDSQASFGGDGEYASEMVGHGDFSTWLFSMLSFKALTAAAAFFGLAGCAASAAQMSPPAQLTIATLAGVGALYGVHWLMKAITGLATDGTARIERSIGKQGTVYLTIPGNRQGTGKVHFKLQNRLVEYAAVTSHAETLPTGSKIRIVNVVGGSTLEVEPALEPKPAATVA